MFKKIIKILPMCMIVLSMKVFAYTYTLPEHCRTWEIYFNLEQNFCIEKLLNMSNTKVKFTQDNTYYYFDVNTDVSLGNGVKNAFLDESLSWYYGSPYDGRTFRSGDLYPYLYGSNNFTDKPIYRHTETHTSNAGEYWTNYEDITVNGNTIAYMNYKDSFNKVKDSYYNTWYNTYFYIPHPLSDYCWFGYGNKWNPSTGDYDLYFPNATEALPSHDGFSLLSRSCTIKNKTMSGNQVTTCTYQVSSKLRIEKTKFSRYRYLAFGGPLYISIDGGNELFIRLKVCCGSSNVYDLNKHIQCNHNWQYTYDDKLGKHTKKCKNCEWTITENHGFVYEYDGIKNNLCECGRTKNVNMNFYINDDYVDEKHFVRSSNTSGECVKYTAKKGYRFLYYEKYEKRPTSTTYSATNTLLNNVLIDTISSVDKIDGKAGYRTLSYYAITEELRFKINYFATDGVFENGEQEVSKNYTYWGIDSLESLYNIEDEYKYFVCWKYNDKEINSIEDIQELIVSQDVVLDLYATYGYIEHEEIEETEESEAPQTESSLNIEESEKNVESETETESETKANVFEYKKRGNGSGQEIKKEFISNNYINLKKKNEDIITSNETEKTEIKINKNEIVENEIIEDEKEQKIYAMSKTNIADFYKRLGLNPATISNIDGKYKYKIDGNNTLIKLSYLLLKHKVLLIIFAIVFVVIYLVLW